MGGGGGRGDKRANYLDACRTILLTLLNFTTTVEISAMSKTCLGVCLCGLLCRDAWLRELAW